MLRTAVQNASRKMPLMNTIRTYSWSYARHDLLAALTVAVVAIPQSMAYAMIAGVDPVFGLYTAIVSTILSAAFGSSEHLIAGPTNAISLLVASAMKSYAGADNFYEMLFLLTFIIGVLQILFGLIRLGKLINYVSHAVIVGFTAGAGVLIALGQFSQLLGGALPIAIIGLVEAISIAKSIASSSGQKIDVNREFVGQGIANAASSFFQCFPGSGSFTRSAINYFSGAKTRMAGIASGVVCILILLFGAPYARFIPRASLAGVIMVIAFSMVNRQEMKRVSKAGRSDALVMWVTFGATVLMPDLDWAIYMGIAISIVLYLKATNRVPVKILLPVEVQANRLCERKTTSVLEKVDILIVQLEGNLYFGSAGDLEEKLASVESRAQIYILRMKTVSTIDLTALNVIQLFIRKILTAGGNILVCGLKSGLNTLLINSDLSKEIGPDHIFLAEEEIFASSVKALKKAQEIIGQRKLTDAG